MFRIYDGRNHFYQWDIDRKLIVEDANINEVHFCNGTTDSSLVCQTYEDDKYTLVDVPNVLLQDNWRIKAYGYDTNHTKHCATFDVVARTKPDTYVYTETEHTTLISIEKLLTDIEENIGVVAEDYLRENAELLRGEKGETGENGYTPQLGIDYWTESQITQMVNDVMDALPKWTGGEY